MPIFGEYETVEQISITEEPRHVTTVWMARKSGPPDGRSYAVKCYAPRPGRVATGQPEDALQQDQSLTFLEGIKQLKRARTGGASCLALVHAFGFAPEGAWYVTDYYERGTLKEYIDLQGWVDSEALRQVVYSVTTGCLAMKQLGGGKTHGNLKPSNMLLAGKPCPLRKTPLHLTDPYPAPRQLAALDTADRRTGGDMPDTAMEIQDLRAIGELILQLVEGRLLRNVYEYNYPVVHSDKWEKLGKAGESWRGLCNRLLDPRLSLEKESLEELERACRPKVAAAKLLVVMAALGGIFLIVVAAYFAVSARGKSVKGHRTTLEQRDQTLVIKPDDAAATKVTAEAQTQLDLAQKANESELQYQAALNAGRSALERKEYAEVIKQARVALGIKPDDPAATKVKADAQTQLDVAQKAKEQELQYQAALNAGRSALERKDYAEVIKQARVALGINPDDPAATKVKAEAQTQLDVAQKAKEQELQYQAALNAGRSALERKDYAEVIKQARVALGVKPKDATATKLRADAQAQLDSASKGKGPGEEHPASDHPGTSPGYDAARLSYIKRVSLLVGKNVYSKGSFSSVGKLEDFALDLATGRLAMGLISSGSDQLATPVPSRTFTSVTAKESFIGVDKKTFSSAPQVLRPNWIGRIDASNLGSVFRQFGQVLPEATVNLAGFSSGTSLIGRHLVSQAGEPLGQLEDMMVDLAGGRVVFLVVKPVAGPDPDKRLYVLPPASVHLDTNGDSLVLNASLARFIAGPHFSKEYWTEMISSDLAARVYQYYVPREGQGGANWKGESPNPKELQNPRPERVVAQASQAR